METLFILLTIWLFQSYYVVYLQTGFYGYLLASLGAGMTVFASVFLVGWQFEHLFLIAGKVLFFIGLGLTFTFGSKIEVERLQTSRWVDILLGRVPTHLQKWKRGTKTEEFLTAIGGLGLSSILYVTGNRRSGIAIATASIILLTYVTLGRSRTGDNSG